MGKPGDRQTALEKFSFQVTHDRRNELTFTKRSKKIKMEKTANVRNPSITPTHKSSSATGATDAPANVDPELACTAIAEIAQQTPQQTQIHGLQTAYLTFKSTNYSRKTQRVFLGTVGECGTGTG